MNLAGRCSDSAVADRLEGRYGSDEKVQILQSRRLELLGNRSLVAPIELVAVAIVSDRNNMVPWVFRKVALDGRFRGREVVAIWIPLALARHVNPTTVVELSSGGEPRWEVRQTPVQFQWDVMVVLRKEQSME